VTLRLKSYRHLLVWMGLLLALAACRDDSTVSLQGNANVQFWCGGLHQFGFSLHHELRSLQQKVQQEFQTAQDMRDEFIRFRNKFMPFDDQLSDRWALARSFLGQVQEEKGVDADQARARISEVYIGVILASTFRWDGTGVLPSETRFSALGYYVGNYIQHAANNPLLLGFLDTAFRALLFELNALIALGRAKFGQEWDRELIGNFLSELMHHVGAVADYADGYVGNFWNTLVRFTEEERQVYFEDYATAAGRYAQAIETLERPSREAPYAQPTRIDVVPQLYQFRDNLNEGTVRSYEEILERASQLNNFSHPFQPIEILSSLDWTDETSSLTELGNALINRGPIDESDSELIERQAKAADGIVQLVIPDLGPIMGFTYSNSSPHYRGEVSLGSRYAGWPQIERFVAENLEFLNQSWTFRWLITLAADPGAMGFLSAATERFQLAISSLRNALKASPLTSGRYRPAPRLLRVYYNAMTFRQICEAAQLQHDSGNSSLSRNQFQLASDLYKGVRK